VLTVFRHFDTQNMIIWYSPKTLRFPAILGCAGLSLLLGVLGFGIGLSSAGAKRNTRNRQSWLGFFVGAAAVTASVILFAAFFLLKQSTVG
jgi:VIT1/CCC1 family predicted Fe2+/Mn2+ transporter